MKELSSEGIGFVQGVVWAVARICEMHDEPTIAADILNEAGYTTYRTLCSQLHTNG